MMQEQGALGRGFADAVFDSQRSFRATLSAMSLPGQVQTVQPVIDLPAGLAMATASVLLALADFETPIWLPEQFASGEACAWLRFHCAAPLASDPAQAAFAVISSKLPHPSLASFNPGTDQFPDRSATLILQCDNLIDGEVVTLSGPGIEKPLAVSPSGLIDNFWDDAELNAGLYPLGVDFILACRSQIIGLPRTTQIRRAG